MYSVRESSDFILLHVAVQFPWHHLWRDCHFSMVFCVCVCVRASTMLFWWLQLCSIVWSQGAWFLHLCSLFLGLLWVFEVFRVYIQIKKKSSVKNAIANLIGVAVEPDCLGWYSHFDSIDSSSPRAWCIFPSVIDSFHQHLTVFRVQVFCPLCRLIHR